MTTEEMIQAMVSRAKGKSFSVYGTYERDDDEHGCCEVEYCEVDIKDDTNIVCYYDVLITDHKRHATYREAANLYFDELPLEEQVDLYEQVMEKIEEENYERTLCSRT